MAGKTGNGKEETRMEWMLCVVCAVFGVLMIVAAAAVVAAWRLGLRDGLRAAAREEPVPFVRAPQQDKTHPPDDVEDRELAKQLEEIDRFDGWK